MWNTSYCFEILDLHKLKILFILQLLPRYHCSQMFQLIYLVINIIAALKTPNFHHSIPNMFGLVQGASLASAAIFRKNLSVITWMIHSAEVMK